MDSEITYNDYDIFSTDKKYNSPLVLFIYFSILLISLFLATMAPPSISKSYLSFSHFLFFVIFFIQVFQKAKLPRPVNWFTVDILFMIIYFVVHDWYSFGYVMGFLPDSIEVWRNPAVVCKAAMLSITGLVAFMIGFNIYPIRYTHVTPNYEYDILIFKKWKLVGTFLFLIGAFITVIYLNIFGKTIVSSTYGHFGGYWASVLYSLFGIILGIGFSVLTISAAKIYGKWQIGILLKIAIGLFILYTLVFGDRSGVFISFAIILAGYTEYIKPMSFKKILFGLFAGIFIFSVAAVARQSPERTLTSFVQTALYQKHEISFEEGAARLSANVRCWHEALSSVPGTYNYFKGVLKTSELLGIVPFVRAFMPKKFQYAGSSEFFTWIINGNFESGVGSTIVADMYVDFGIFGIVFGLFFLGWLSRYVQQKARMTGSLIWGVAHCSLVATVAMMPRYTMTAQLIRGVLWPVLLLIFIRIIFSIPKESVGQTNLYINDEVEINETPDIVS